MDGGGPSGDRAGAGLDALPKAPPTPGARARARALRLLGAAARPHEHLARERHRWFAWLPVTFGSGIATYFALPHEPGLGTTIALPLVALGLLWASAAAPLARLLSLAVLAMALGFVAAKARTEAVRAPVLGYELRYAEVDGIVELIEQRPTRGERLTLRVVSVARLPPDAQPFRVRIRAMRKTEGLKPGDRVRLRATLRPPAIPALPGGYDFSRMGWFQGLGATGFSLSPATIVARGDAAEGFGAGAAKAALEAIRHAIGERIRAAVPGESGAIAVSLITGERGGITDATNDAYRDSGLVHILSISGLHMVIMAGAVYGFVRLLLAAFPAIALRFATKKWAAAAALIGAGGYLLISGSSIPTLRAALMITIMFVAVMMDRQALAMRNVALAALVILAVTPESLLDAGFQMSFAAVVALIAAYEVVRDRSEASDRSNLLRPVAAFVGGVVLSTVIASLAVAPFGVYNFHRTQQYALLANLIAVPICNLIIMPMALLTLVALPMGLEQVPLIVMAFGIDMMTATAYRVAAMPGAVAHIGAIPAASFALMVGGGLWLTLWQTRWRALGLAAIGLGLLTAGSAPRPDLLAGRDGTLVAVRGADGRLVASGSRAGSYELSRWLEHDGDSRSPREALRAKGFACDGTGCVMRVGNLRVAVHRHAAATEEDCLRSDILIGGPPRPKGCTRPLVVLDRTQLRNGGTHAVYLARDEATGATRIARIETVAGLRGTRPWTERPRRRPRFGASARPRSTNASSPRATTDEGVGDDPS